MEKRIKRGQYEFPENEWGLISDQAKAIIDGMLETQPERRLTIDKIIKNKWLIVRKFYLFFVSAKEKYFDLLFRIIQQYRQPD